MENILIHIENAFFGYGSNKILYADNLIYNKGEITFILGESGIGKSTFIESIGIMNQTLLEDSNAENKCQLYTRGSEKIDLYNIWEKGNKIISKIRSNHLSFIFQNTNLLEKLSVGDNLKIVASEKFGDEKLAQKIIEGFIELKLVINESEGYKLLEKPVYELSGGQRQRIAFLRGLITDFELLICDEPTGNLDQITSLAAMNYLKKVIKEENRSALIVTHNLELAKMYGDRIQFIDRKYNQDLNTEIGYISNSNAFDTKLEKDIDSWLKNKIDQL